MQDGGASEPARLHVGHLTRNITEEHVHEIFGTFGKLKSVELAIDRVVNLPRCRHCGRLVGVVATVVLAVLLLGAPMVVVVVVAVDILDKMVLVVCMCAWQGEAARWPLERACGVEVPCS